MPDDYYVSQYSGEEIDALLGGAGAGTVRYDAAQSLTDAQKQQARTNIAAAPSGFGLGENRTIGPMMSVVTADTLDTTYNNGWYFANGVNIAGFTQAVVRVDSSGRTIFQTAFVALNNYILRRYLVDTVGTAPNNSFSPWEWVNPPMRLGIEYRTTERYLGKPVYVKTVQAFLSLTGSDAVNICEVPVDNVDKCVSCTGHTDSWSLPSDVIGGSNYIYIGTQVYTANTIRILARTNRSDSWSVAVYVTIKYTKTTE